MTYLLGLHLRRLHRGRIWKLAITNKNMHPCYGIKEKGGRGRIPAPCIRSWLSQYREICIRCLYSYLVVDLEPIGASSRTF